MDTETIDIGLDLRDDTSIGSDVRWFVWRLQRSGLSLTLTDGGRNVLVSPKTDLSDHDQKILRCRFHAIRDLLLEESDRPM